MSQASLLNIARRYAETCRLTEQLRITEPYPFAEWQAAWEERKYLQSQLCRAARGLKPRALAARQNRAGETT